MGPSGGGFLKSSRCLADAGSVGAERGGSLSVVLSFVEISFFGGALNFCEISGFGAVGVGLEEALKAKLNFPDAPDWADPGPVGVGRDGAAGVSSTSPLGGT